MNNKSSSRAIIRQTILDMERPFSISDLFHRLESKYNIKNKQLALNILEELCESGLIKYSEVVDHHWAFEVVPRVSA